MKILIAHNFYRSEHIGGEDTVVLNEVAALKKQLGESNVHTYYVYNDNISSVALLKNIWGNKEHAQQIVELINKHQIDLLHVHNEFPLLTPLVFKAAYEQGVKIVQTLHNFRGQCLSGTLYRQNALCEQCVHQKIKWPGVMHRCYRNSYLQSTVHAMAQYWYHLKQYQSYIHHYFVLTHFQKSKLIDFGLNPQQLLLKPNFIMPQIEHYRTDIEREGYVFIGRIESGKGIEYLLKNWVTLPKHFVLRIIGSGEDLEKLQDKYAQENIIFLGKLEHVKAMQLLQKAKYLIHTSLYYETFGLTILEAMSCGVPVIGFNIGTRKDFIVHEENGLLSDEDKLRETLLSSFEHPRYMDMSKNAYEFSLQFTPASIIPQQIMHYENIIKGKYL